METVTSIIHAPETITFGLVVAGVLLTKVIWPYLEAVVKKTPSLSDDQFLTSIEKIVNDALAAKKAKK